jgi:hypothetical protein
MNRPVEINIEEINHLIRENRTVYRIIERHVAKLAGLIRDLKWLAAEATTNLLTIDPCVCWGAQIHSYEADLAVLRLQQAKQDEIHEALQQLIEAAKSRATRSCLNVSSIPLSDIDQDVQVEKSCTIPLKVATQIRRF